MKLVESYDLVFTINEFDFKLALNQIGTYALVVLSIRDEYAFQGIPHSSVHHLRQFYHGPMTFCE